MCEGIKLRQDLRYKNTFIYAIEFTNSNPKIVSLFVKFMKKILKIELNKIKGQLFIYPDINKEKVMKIWSSRTGAPIEQFQKIIMLKPKSSKFKHNPLGTFKVRYSEKEKFLGLQDIMDDIWRDARVV
jgi:hypothetical protein